MSVVALLPGEHQTKTGHSRPGRSIVGGEVAVELAENRAHRGSVSTTCRAVVGSILMDMATRIQGTATSG